MSDEQTTDAQFSDEVWDVLELCGVVADSRNDMSAIARAWAESDDIRLKEVNALRLMETIRERRAAVDSATSALVLQGWRDGLSQRAMANSLGVSQTKIRGIITADARTREYLSESGQVES